MLNTALCILTDYFGRVQLTQCRVDLSYPRSARDKITILSSAWWHRVVVAASSDNNVESVDWDQAPGVTTMVLSIWHYYVISDQRHTMVSVSELRRRWLITMALSVHTPHQPGHAERWGAVTRYSQIHHQHRTQHPGISHPLTSHTESDPRIYLLSLVISFPPENQFSDYISPVRYQITLFLGKQ